MHVTLHEEDTCTSYVAGRSCVASQEDHVFLYYMPDLGLKTLSVKYTDGLII